MLIFSNKCGQLGNRLFAFAHLITVAEANGVVAINLSFDEYARYFTGTYDNLLCQYPKKRTLFRSSILRSFLFNVNKAIVKCLRILRLKTSFAHQIIEADLPEYAFNRSDCFDLADPHFIQSIRSKKFSFLFGRFFRDYKNIESCSALIRAYFTPIDEVRLDIQRFHSALKSGTDVLVGVHIRRGDYIQFVDGKYFFSDDDYLKKMIEVSRLFPGKSVKFVICSNEEIDLSFFSGISVFKGPGHLVKDMYLLAECDYIMGPPSTYTLWASFYGRKPLYQLRDIQAKVGLNEFVLLPTHVLYNFSFN